MDSPSTRVFKKSSPNGKLTVYLEKRDFVDHLDHVEPVDGVLLVDPGSMKDKKVFVNLMCVFRGGREDLDVLGLSFRKDLYTHTVQVFPLPSSEERPQSPLQERLAKKLGQHAHPFCLTIPHDLPCSVGLQSGPEDSDQSFGVDFELKAFYARTAEDKTNQRSSVHLVIRKIQYAPENPGPRLIVETSRSFLLSDRLLHLEASLNKELHYHGEPIDINVLVTNGSSRTVKKVKISVWQCADICLFASAQYRCQIAQLEAEHHVSPNTTSCKVFTVTPTLKNNREKRGLALDGKFKDEDTNLASSSIVTEGCDKEAMAIVVSYLIKVRLVVSFGGDVIAELPFSLMHPRPANQPNPQPAGAAGATGGVTTAIVAGPSGATSGVTTALVAGHSGAVAANLIDLEVASLSQIDDFVFEDFTRKQLTGLDDGEEEDRPLF